MTLPNGVTIKPEGTTTFVTERGYWTPPNTSCMFASLCMMLEYMGYDLPLNRAAPSQGEPDNFVHTLHINSGAPLTRGTSTAETKIALQRTFGLDNMPAVSFGVLDDATLLEQLSADWAVRVTVSHCQTLPLRLRRWVGRSYNGGHALALLDARQTNGVWEVFWMDPMGRTGKKYGYKGEWVNWDSVKASLRRSDGLVQVTVGEKDAAVPVPEPPVDPEPPEEPTTGVVPMIINGVRDQFIPVKKGTPFLRTDNLAVVTKSAVDGDFGVVGYSEDGKYAALRVRTLKFKGGLVVLFAERALLGEPYVRVTPAI